MLKASRPFWVVSPAVAAKQIVVAVEARRSVAYVPQRWQAIAWLLKLLPDAVFTKFA